MIELVNVSAGYGKNTVLEGISTRIEKGKLTSVIGANGCGKSTLLKVILGTVRPTCGDALIDESSVSTLSRVEIAKRVAYLPQEKNTPDMTVMQMVLHGRFPYLSYPRRYSREDMDIAADALASMGISELAQASMHTLSGGMRQNAYIAMALAQNTDHILLDEPTTYLDISHQLSLMKLLRGLADGGKGIVAVMHDLPAVFEFSDEIIVLDGGRIAAQGDPQELYRTSVIRDVFGVELKRTENGGKYYYNL